MVTDVVTDALLDGHEGIADDHVPVGRAAQLAVDLLAVLIRVTGPLGALHRMW